MFCESFSPISLPYYHSNKDMGVIVLPNIVQVTLIYGFWDAGACQILNRRNGFY